MQSLMTVWAEGWSATRNHPSPRATAYGRYVEVGLPEQRGRHVVDERANALIPELAASIVAPWTFIKALGSPEDIAAMIPQDWSIDPTVWLMTASLDRPPAREVGPTGYRATLTHERALLVELHDDDGRLGASGRAAIVGRCCVFDQIITSEDHRRRGLGSDVMRRLSQQAVMLGAATGVLVATDDGRALYGKLGWALEGPLTSAVRPAP
jgi:GNAT superfamily N-acetyltransferase